MRDALNSNPLVQLGVVGVLLVVVAVFLMSSGGGGGGGEEEGGGTPTEAVNVAGSAPGETVEGAAGSLGSALSGAGSPAASAPPLPRPVLGAWEDNKTLVLLFVRDGGIDDRLVKHAANDLSGFSDVALFVVPAHKIYRYAAISEGVGVERTPALVVVTPKHLDKSVPTASVSYGFQSSESVAQAVIDAGYKGPTVGYHP